MLTSQGLVDIFSVFMLKTRWLVKSLVWGLILFIFIIKIYFKDLSFIYFILTWRIERLVCKTLIMRANRFSSFAFWMLSIWFLSWKAKSYVVNSKLVSHSKSWEGMVREHIISWSCEFTSTTHSYGNDNLPRHLISFDDSYCSSMYISFERLSKTIVLNCW